jgi:hypothetical protein
MGLLGGMKRQEHLKLVHALAIVEQTAHNGMIARSKGF